MKIKKTLILLILGMASLVLIVGCSKSSSGESGESNGDKSAASDWPSKDIHINVHSGPGNLDTAIRQLSPLLSEELGVDVIVENRPGGGQSISQTATQTAPADGYTLQSKTSSTSFGMAQGQIPFDPEDWSMVYSLQKEPASIAVLADSPLESIDDFVETMKNDPGKLVVGGYGSAGFMTYVYYQLQKIAGFEGKWIPIDTTDKVAASLLGGHIDVAVMTPSTALSAVQSGEVKLLGVSTEERSENYPDIPTFKEQGYDVVEVLWRGLSVKKGTPKEIVNKLHEAIKSATQTEEWLNFQKKRNQENDTTSPEKLDERLANEVEGRTQFLKDMGLLNN
ncbi:Bug family tripartite tricarboxylate transporter substrate binding protein [Virgibacillus ndiopensis]|uniref:Bug family tripartite tricarboxylate transporter substrate binding protein n=1 Tax=Virgibacillus ndiopensis TaxID=2004408 RepID=UPI000C089473|nr:tripartite tricarboxylate transporter substrate binding protein [Virgibacillus ndiopensis]